MVMSCKLFQQALFAVFFFVLIVVSASAKTVTLVYDDSGSMGGKGKWQNANYAVQVLGALLADDDALFIVRMNGAADGESFELDFTKRSETLQEILSWPAPVQLAATPYRSVETAVHILKASQEGVIAHLGMKETDWLIIVTDGQFEETENDADQKAYWERVKKHAASFFSTRDGRQTRVAFLLIGNNADEKTANIWKRQAPASDQIEVFRSGSDDISGAMERIAQRITGRDQKLLKAEFKGDTMHFLSIFPLKRFSIFEQRSDEKLVSVKKQGIKIPGTQMPQMRSFDISTPKNGDLQGRVTHVQASTVMPVGEYSVTFNEDLREHKLNLLVEPSVDFKVTVFGEDGKEFLLTDSGKYSVCEDEMLYFQISFIAFENGREVSFPISKQVAKGLSIKGTFNGETAFFIYDEKSSNFSSSVYVMDERENSLRVEASYPGYFQIKSNVISLVQKKCGKDVEIIVDGEPIAVKHSTREEYHKAGSVSLRRQGDNYSGRETLSVPDLPEGVMLQVQGKTIRTAGDEVEIDLDSPAEVTILTNDQFVAVEQIAFKLDVTADDSYVKIKNSEQVVLRPQSRKVELIAENDKKWYAEYLELGDVPGPIFYAVVDGQRISMSEQSSFQLSAVTDNRIGLQVVPGENGSGYRLRVDPYFIHCLTAIGDIPVQLTLQGTLPSEKVEKSVVISIEELSWWDRCLGTLIVLSCVLFLFIWLLACYRKNRFRSTAFIEYKNEKIGIRQKKRPGRFSLSAGKSENNKIIKIFFAYCWPFGVEKARVKGLVFYASDSAGSIYLSKKSLRNGMQIGYLLIDETERREDKRLGSGDEIIDSNNSYKQTYTFKIQ